VSTSDKVIESERSFFDQEASRLEDHDLVMGADLFERYRQATIAPSNIPYDTLFAHLRPLDGKRVLDYCCGTGETAAILAACGATVVGFDLSPESIRIARRRAELNGLANRVSFEVKRAGETGYEPASFDAVVARAALHHVHTMIPAVFDEIATLLKPNGVVCIVEPMADNVALRLLRPLVPLSRCATEHERQLTSADFNDLERRFSSIKRYYYYNLERLERLLGTRVGRRLRLVDHYLQNRIPMLRSLYGHILIVARRR
jgi:ubiquinone/menaquinone biosynthesis C-methylase UbiE